MIRENQFLEIIEYQFARTVFVTLDFIDDDFYLLVYFGLRKSTMENDVCQQFHGTGEMFGQESTVYDCFFLVGISIEITAYIFHSVDDVPGMSFLSTLENQVFHKVSHSLFVLGFISCPGINSKATIGHCRLIRCVNDADSVG